MRNKLIIGLLAGALLIPGLASAAEKSRVRLTLPLSASYTSQTASPQSETSSNFKASSLGFGLHYITAMGLGLGYTSSDLRLKADTAASSQNRLASSLDISYTSGSTLSSNLSGTVGMGMVVGGDWKSDVATLTDKKIGGTAIILGGAYAFGAFEAGMNYRMNNYTHYGKFGVASFDYKTSYSELQLSLGYLF